jgi:hypothetical protein
MGDDGGGMFYRTENAKDFSTTVASMIIQRDTKGLP